MSLVIKHFTYFTELLVFYEEIVSKLLKFLKYCIVQVKYLLNSHHFTTSLKLQQTNQSSNNKIKASNPQSRFL